MPRSFAHRVRNLAVSAASLRPFKPAAEVKNRLVVVRPDHFGDLLLLGPALSYLEKRATDHELYLMTGPWNTEVSKHIAPDWRQITWEFPGFTRAGVNAGISDPYRQIGKAAELLRSIAPQAIMLPRDDHWWGAWTAREAGIPVRVGYNNRQLGPFLTHPVDIPNMHYVRQNLELARSTLAVLGYDMHVLDSAPGDYPLRWPVSQDAKERDDTLVTQHDLSSGFAVIHPGTGAPVKQWPANRWAQVANSISKDTTLKIVLTGAPDELSLCNEIARKMNNCHVSVLAGETSLFELGELFRSAVLVLGVDSGPLHLATAVGTPSIHLFGPSDQVRYGPWGDPKRHRVISAAMSCPDCGNLSPTRAEGCGCMTAISVDEVSATAIELLHDTP